MTTPVGNSDDGAMFSSKPEEIETFTGRFVNLLDPDPDTIVIEDIAHHLAQQTRYGGAGKRFYSVAEHCCLVMDLIPWVPIEPMGVVQLVNSDFSLHTLQLAALFHDAPEAYLNDVTAPAKFSMRELMVRWIESYLTPYDYLEERMGKVINDKFGITQMARPEIKIADMWAMKIEAKQLTHSGGKNWRWNGELPLGGTLPAGVDFRGGTTPEIAERLFLFRYSMILKRIARQKQELQEEAK